MAAAASTWAPQEDAAQHLQQLQVGLPVSNRRLLVSANPVMHLLLSPSQLSSLPSKLPECKVRECHSGPGLHAGRCTQDKIAAFVQRARRSTLQTLLCLTPCKTWMCILNALQD